MSRMTKFLRQQCLVQPYLLDDAKQPKLNDFGEIQYGDPILCSCRHEIVFRDIQTANGSIVRSRSRYFLDESVSLAADYKIDGNPILAIESYINGLGKCEGYEVYV